MIMVNEKPVPVSPCGQYIRSTKELGKGNQRVVFRGNDLRTGRGVAWCEPKSKGEVEWDTFTKSSTLLENVKHKNIVSFIEFWEASPNSSRTPVLIAELMGCTLKQHIQQSPRGFDSSAIKSWAHQILEAVGYLQSPHHGLHHVIVHRTLRCDHVCINPFTGEVKVSSFGSAVLKDRGTYLEEPVGSVEFMSPEMASYRYNETTDIYSYGVCLLEMVTGEYPYEECDKISQALQCLKSEKYPKSLDQVSCPYTRDLIRSCIEHNVDKRITLSQILSHRYFQEVKGENGSYSAACLSSTGLSNGTPKSPLPSGWPKISYQSFDGEIVTISISYPENPSEVQLYSFNLLAEQSRYVAASLVRGDFIKESHLQDATVQIHKIMEKVKRQTRIKTTDMMDYFQPLPQPLPGPTKTPKTPKVVLTLCSFDVEEHHVELELSQTRIGKIVKFQFGILDNEAEEIAENLVKEGHLVEENKADFLSQLNTIVQEQRDVAKAQQEEVDEAEEPEVVSDDVIEPSDKVVETDSPSEPASMETSSSNNNGDLSIEVRQRLSRENVTANHSSNNHNNHVTNSGNHVTSPDLDTRSQLSESGSNIPIDTFNSAKSLMNGMDTLKSPPVAVSGAMPFTSNYFRQQGGMMFYPQPTPQYMMMPPGAGMHQMPPQMPGHHQIPGALQHNSYMVMPPSLYPNGHIAAGWGHGAPIVRSQAELNAMRLPVTATGHPLTAGAAHHIATAVPHMSGGAAHHMSPYMGGCGTQNAKVEKDTRQIVRGDQDTPPPTFRPDLVATPIDSRLET